MKRTILTGVAMSVLVGCLPSITEPDAGGGGGGGSGSGDATPRALFDRTVAPSLQRCTGCHVGPEAAQAQDGTDRFLGPSTTNDSYYKGIEKDRRVNGNWLPADAELLTKGAHSNVMWWSGPESKAISDWLDAESTARDIDHGGGGDGSGGGSGSGGAISGKPATARAAEQQWASCLAVSTDAYESTKVYLIGQMNSTQGRCYSCHSPGGAGGAFWSDDKALQLHKWQEEVFISAPFQAQEQVGTPVTYKMAAARGKICDKGTEKNNNAGDHPTYDCQQQVNGVQPIVALDQFVTAVQANADAGKCPLPGMFAPQD